MENGSVSDNVIVNSVVVTGDGNRITLTIGGVALTLDRKQFRARRPRRELQILNPNTTNLPFVGRGDSMAELRGWVNDPADVSVHALIGKAGTGKTRLAMELCGQVDADRSAQSGWLAGFLPASDVKSIPDRDLIWPRPMLLVIDYAGQCGPELARWLDRLAANPPATKLRILLLEREAPDGFGWWHDLAQPVLFGDAARQDLFHAERPTLVPDLSQIEQRRAIVANALAAARAIRPAMPNLGEIPAAGTDPGFDAELGHARFGNPLSLVMAGVLALDRAPQAALGLRRLDAARMLGGREIERLRNLVNESDRETMDHIVLFNLLAGGLPLATLRESIAAELTADHRGPIPNGVTDLLEQEFPPNRDDADAAPDRLGTIQPDLIQEGAIVSAFARAPARKIDEPPAILARAYALGEGAAASVLVRLVQDFAYAAEDPGATAEEQETGKRLLGWLTRFSKSIADPMLLIPLVNALPEQTTILRELAATLTATLAGIFRNVPHDADPTIVDFAARLLNNLSVRLSALGQREPALDAAREAVALYRTLAAARPDAFTPDLAVSLNNLAAMLSALGQREQALDAAREAVALRRTLAAARPDAFTPNLAGSLRVLGDLCAEAERREEALALLHEAIGLLTPFLAAVPPAFAGQMVGVCQSYIARCEEAEQEPDEALLGPVGAILQALQQQVEQT